MWEKDSKKHSLEELRENYNYWKDHFKEATEKYWNLDKDEKDKEISTFMGKITYFLYLSKISWNSLSAYTEKLQKESKTLKKSQKVKKKPKTRKRKV
ncbi:MAG: hypothetical protein IIC67_01555 [Thaumarchaeota archaeon]|nr:hypothetical protein [Nitrososphaerota archaeon]